MKTGDVEKIVDIQWAKTLKNEKAKIALIFTKKQSLVSPYISNKNLYRYFSNFFLGCPIIAHNFWSRLRVYWFLYHFHQSYFPFTKYWWSSVTYWPCMHKKQIFFAYNVFFNAPAIFSLFCRNIDIWNLILKMEA